LTSSADLAAGPLLLIDDTLLELHPTGVCVCHESGVIRRFNRKALSLWGRAPEPGHETFCGAHRLRKLDGTMLPHNQSPMAMVLRHGKPVSDHELLMETPNGDLVWVLVNVEPVRNAAGGHRRDQLLS